MMRLVLAGLAMVVAGMASGESSPVTFAKDVLPILQQNCQSCHRPGQIAPMSLLSYQEARPWARAIKAAVVTRKMPPWFADTSYGHFVNAFLAGLREDRKKNSCQNRDNGDDDEQLDQRETFLRLHD